MIRTAHISDDGKYRYSLSRVWNPNKPTLVFIMLNPSTADADKDDATIRKCMRIAEHNGFGGIEVVNLFAYRCTDPKDLPVSDVEAYGGPLQTEAHMRVAGNFDSKICVAWGDNIDKGEQMLPTKLSRGRALYCLGVTKKGEPRHPLYRKDTQTLEPFAVRHCCLLCQAL